MSKRNREKRAARKRDRQRRGPTPPRHGFPGPHGPGCTCGEPDDFWTAQAVSPAEFAHMLLAAAQAHADGDATASQACAAELSSGGFAGQSRAVATGAGIAMTELVHRLWQAGWLPVDLWEITRRRADDAATNLLV